MEDFPEADAEARALDKEVASKAQSVGGGKHADIVTLSTRQVFGALDLTIPEDTLDTRDIMAFVKEISSNGNVNTVDVILPISPILYVLAPEYIRLLAEPLLRYLASGAWPHNYTIHDIGSHYPNATGHDDGKAEPMPVEECANILLLAALHQHATGDATWTQHHAGLFQQYADYLVAHGLYPTAQLSSDDGAGVVANQTGLATKAAIALCALRPRVREPAILPHGPSLRPHILFVDGVGTDPARTHFTLTQDDARSWALAYNLYLDAVLALDAFPASAHAMASRFYPSVRGEAGVPLDSRVGWGKTDWMMFGAATAAVVGETGVREMFVDDVHGFLTNGRNDAPFGDNFFVSTNWSEVAGEYDTYRARPVVGGHFALMALEGPNQIGSGGGQGKRSIPGSWMSRVWHAIRSQLHFV